MLSRSSTGRLPFKPKPEKQKKEETKPATKISSKVKVAPIGRINTVFSSAYTKGQIPLRLIHGSVKHKVTWTSDINRIDYSIIVLFFEGLVEHQHPYNVLVELGLQDLLSVSDAREKIVPFLGSIAGPLRNALKVNFLVSSNIFIELIRVVGEAIVPYLNQLLPPIQSKVFDQEYTMREACQNVLQELQMHANCLDLIRKRIPTYHPPMF